MPSGVSRNHKRPPKGTKKAVPERALAWVKQHVSDAQDAETECLGALGRLRGSIVRPRSERVEDEDLDGLKKEVDILTKLVAFYQAQQDRYGKLKEALREKSPGGASNAQGDSDSGQARKLAAFRGGGEERGD